MSYRHNGLSASVGVSWELPGACTQHVTWQKAKQSWVHQQLCQSLQQSMSGAGAAVRHLPALQGVVCTRSLLLHPVKGVTVV